jgi:small ligand-binding sensory domain FIST
MAAANMPTGDEIFGQWIAPAPWVSSRPALDVAIEALPAIEDDIARDIIAHLGHAIVNVRDELAALRATLSAALTHAHGQHVEIMRLRQRLADTHGARRAERRAV